MLILHSPQILHQKVTQWSTKERIYFVPTMGCLHRGHMALIDRAKREEGKVIVSIFVNPLQFGPSEDFDKYPRPFEEDVKLLEEAGVDCLFAPRTIDLYPEGYSTKVSVGKITDHLCGKSRPGHFEGVTTVCLKLFEITQASAAIFGEKDFQQVRVLEKMIEDLNLSIRIIRHSIVREPDGLALSSRNRYLSPEDRETASKIPLALMTARERALADATLSVSAVLDSAKQKLVAGVRLEYLEVASAEDLVPMPPDTLLLDIRNPRLFIAARVGDTRLIDNVALHLTEG